jgi:hypothetical protein
MNRNSSVGIEMSYGLGGQGSIPGRWKTFFFSTASIQALGPTQSLIQWVPGDLSLGIKRQGREADHSPPSNTKVKKGETIPPLPHTSAWRGPQVIKHRGKFTLCLRKDFNSHFQISKHLYYCTWFNFICVMLIQASLAFTALATHNITRPTNRKDF